MEYTFKNIPGRSFTREQLLAAQKHDESIFCNERFNFNSSRQNFYEKCISNHMVGVFLDFVDKNNAPATPRHIHADLMIAYAKDCTLKFQFKSKTTGRWGDEIDPNFDPSYEYRPKPKTIVKVRPGATFSRDGEDFIFLRTAYNEIKLFRQKDGVIIPNRYTDKNYSEIEEIDLDYGV